MLGHPPIAASKWDDRLRVAPEWPKENAPLSAAVESDVVGYVAIEMEAGKWYQVGTPFVSLTDDAKQTLNSAFGTGFATGDMAHIYNPESGVYGSPYVYVSATEDGVEAGWYNRQTGQLADVELKPGQAVFVQKSASGNPLFLGRVSNSTLSKFGEECDAAYWAQVVCVYPKPLGVNEMKWEGLKSGDELHLYNPGEGDKEGAYSTPAIWVEAEGAYKSGWYDQTTGKFSETTVNVGQAMFINKASGGYGSCAPMIK